MTFSTRPFALREAGIVSAEVDRPDVRDWAVASRLSRQLILRPVLFRNRISPVGSSDGRIRLPSRHHRTPRVPW